MPGPSESPYTPEQDQELAAFLWSLKHDLRKWVQAAFCWGKENTVLHEQKEPRKFQIEILEEMTDIIRDNKIRIQMGLQPKVIRESISSGRGIGKSALFEGILPLWFVSTVLGGTCIVTANTEDQLKNRTWGELGVWYHLLLCKHWFVKNTEAVVPAEFFKKWIGDQLNIDSSYYGIKAQLWSKDNPNAFAGAHSQYGIMLVMAEAIQIPKAVWTVGNGFFRKPNLIRVHLASANPRLSTGEFVETFRGNRDQWRARIIDSRTVEGIDLDEANAVIEKHGENSPEACAEVTGQIPDFSDKQFIKRSVVQDAMRRPLAPGMVDHGAPIYIGVDPARQGNDKSAIKVRQGRDAVSWPLITFEGLDNNQLAGRVIEIYDEITRKTGKKPDAVNVDVGNGAGVIDIMRARGYPVNEIDFGKAAENPKRWANKRTEMWADMRDWLPGGCLEQNQELQDDLTGPEYSFRGDSSVVILEPKESMKERGLHSPDQGDALALTFAVKTARRDIDGDLGPHGYAEPIVAEGMDYPLMG